MSNKVNVDLLNQLHSGWIAQGPRVNQFEEALGKRFRNDQVLTVGTGTHGLTLALMLMNIQRGQSVITTPLSCTATNFPIILQGANIIWADVKKDFNIDPDSIESLITGNTKAIFVVHWGGYPCNMEEIWEIAGRYNLAVVEDGAHAYGSTYKDSMIGECKYSDFTMFSFQAIKHLTSVTPETPVLIKRNNKIELIEIGNLDKDIIGQECMSFTKEGKTKWSKIYDFIKHPIKESILNIKLEKGREVNITKSHSIYSFIDNEFKAVYGKDLKIGDYIAAPRKLNM